VGGTGLVIVSGIPIPDPFPDVARHIIEAVTVGGITFNRRGAEGIVIGLITIHFVTPGIVLSF
jgi:hypothetical protein